MFGFHCQYSVSLCFCSHPHGETTGAVLDLVLFFLLLMPPDKCDISSRVKGMYTCSQLMDSLLMLVVAIGCLRVSLLLFAHIYKVSSIFL